MWIAEQWQDYELLDCGGGEKLERWGEQYLVRPDPQAIWVMGCARGRGRGENGYRITLRSAGALPGEI